MITAGGVASPCGIAAAFGLGTSGVQVGTAFPACPETEIHSAHREMLLQVPSAITQVARTVTWLVPPAIANRRITDMNKISAEPLDSLCNTAWQPARCAKWKV